METVKFETVAYFNLNEKESLLLRYDTFEKVYRLFLKKDGYMYQKYYEGDLIKKAKKLSTINKAAEKYGVEFVPKNTYFIHDKKSRMANTKRALPYDFCNYGHVIDKYKEEKNKVAIVKSEDYIKTNHKNMTSGQIGICLSKDEWEFSLGNPLFEDF